jgi:predicted DNA-binding transcriptional regulator AlpA
MDKLYRLAKVLEITDKKESSWRKLVKLNKAPMPVYLGSRSPRWKEADLIEFIQDPDAYEKKLQNKTK